jgi:hypothetical protein
MRAQIEGNLIETKEVQAANGKKTYFNHTVICEGFNGRKELVEVFSEKNGRKPGRNDFVVDVRIGMFNGMAQMRVSEVAK